MDGWMPHCRGFKFVILGAIIIANEMFFGVNWWYLFGVLLIIKGIIIMLAKDC